MLTRRHDHSRRSSCSASASLSSQLLAYHRNRESFSLCKQGIAVVYSILVRVCIMARSLSSMVLRNMANFHAARLNTQVGGFFYTNGIRNSNTLSNDSDTHEDFRPTSKLGSSGLYAKDIVERDVKENPVMIYMKGDPEVPRCGFSALAVKILNAYDAPITSRNILENTELKNAVKAYSHWPTFPQIFIKGEFIGGSDILLKMHQANELAGKLKDDGDSVLSKEE